MGKRGGRGMNGILALFLSMSFSGSLLILGLLFGKPLYQNRTGRRWQYYVWLIVIARLLLPFSPEKSVSSMLLERVRAGQSVSESIVLQDDLSVSPAMQSADSSEDRSVVKDTTYDKNTDNNLNGLLQDFGIKALSHLWIVWLGVTALIFVRKITVYQGFVKYLKAGWEEVTDMRLLDLLAQTGERAGVKRPVELYTNRLISTPLLIGFIHPCIVLPSAGLSDTDFLYTAWHELVHDKHMDMFYKWLMQITLCLHWFNPLVWLMSREVERTCELACDEAVICMLDGKGRRAYGDTLLHAFRAGDSYENSFPSVMLSAGAKQLKERLGVIMKYKKSSKAAIVLSTALTGLMILAAAAAGVAAPSAARAEASRVVPSEVTGSSAPAQMQINKNNVSTSGGSAEKYYQASNLPAFGRVFAGMDEEEQEVWLDRIYQDGEIAFFSVSLQQLETGSDFVELFAKKAYKDNKISFFSVLTRHMDRKTQKAWLKKAEKDKRTAFQMGLLEELGMDDKLEQLKLGLDQERIAEYKKYGITVKGKSYYYKGKLVNFFLDSQKNTSTYTVSMDPKGTVHVKVTRGTDGIIKSVRRMSDAEVEKLLSPGDGWKELEKEEEKEKDAADEVDKALTKAGGEKITVPVQIDQLKDGKYAWLGTYELAENDKIYYRVSAKEGERLDVGFAKAGSGDPSVTYHTVSNRRTDGKLQVRAGGFAWKKPLKPGKYRLFIHTKEGDLRKVEGAVVIVRSEA